MRTNRNRSWLGCAIFGVALSGAPALLAQTNVFPADGNVGIGTSSPGAKLVVQGTSAEAWIQSDATRALTLGNWDGTWQYIKSINLGSALTPLQFQASVFSFTTGNVGIGTTTPQATLDVAGDAKLSNNLTVGNNAFVTGTLTTSVITTKSGATSYYGQGEVAATSLSSNDLDRDRGTPVGYSILRINNHTGVSISAHSSYGGIRFYNQGYSNTNLNPYDSTIGATLVMALTNGNVGVGTAFPAQRLEVNGQIRSLPSSASRGSYFGTDNVGAYVGNNVYVTPNVGWYNDSTALASSFIYQSGGQLDFYTRAAGAAAGTGNSVFTIAQSGAVGIGTTSPAQRLHVLNGAIRADLGSPGASGIFTGSGSNLHLVHDGTADVRFLNSSGGGYIFMNSANTAGFFAITGGGNVGIGTTSPQQKLHVAGNTRLNNLDVITSIGGGNSRIITFQPDDPTSVNTDFSFNASPAGGAYGSFSVKSAGTTRVRFGLEGLAPTSFIDTPGNFGIGTQTPGAKLDVAGDGRFSGNLTVGGTFTAVGYTASNGTVSGGAAGLTLNAGGSEQSVTLQGSGYGGAVIAQNLNGTDSYPLRVKNGMLKANNNYVGMMLQSNDATNSLTGGLLLYGGSNRRIELGAYDNGVGPANVVVPYGNVAIGTANLAYGGQLTVKNAGPQQNFLAGETADFSANSAGTQLNLGFGAASGNTYGVINTLSGGGVAWNNLVLQSGGGSVGIGTTNPGTYKLAVNGTVHAKEVVVDQTGWADDVFDPSYRNAPLSEVEQHIKEHGHLPGVPTAQEATADGISVGQMQATLLRKIEELTLHQIEQEKILKAQAAQIKELQEQNAALRR